MEYPIKPMEPMRGVEIYDDPDTIYQVKWDGVRCLAYQTADSIRLFNRKLHERTQQFPEMVQDLDDLPQGTVLDGEVVVMGSEGRPNFFHSLKRDLVRKTYKIPMLMQTYPVDYMIFDILYHRGESVMERPLTERMALLHEVVRENGRLHLVDSVIEQGSALFQAVEAEGLEGVVAKRKDSPYLIGQKTPLWKKIKAWREVDTLIGGYIVREGQLRSLLVGIPEDSGLRCVGGVASGLTEEMRSFLMQHFNKHQLSAPPFINPPRESCHWVKPILGVRVRYLEWSNHGSLRNPSIVDFYTSEAIT